MLIAHHAPWKCTRGSRIVSRNGDLGTRCRWAIRCTIRPLCPRGRGWVRRTFGQRGKNLLSYRKFRSDPSLLLNKYFFSKNCAIYGTDRPLVKIHCDAEKMRFAYRITKTRLQKRHRNISYLLFCLMINSVWSRKLIYSNTKSENCATPYTSKEGHEQRNVPSFQYTIGHIIWRHT